MTGAIHVVNAFESAMRGSERATLAAARRLARSAAVTVWSTGQVPAPVSVLARSFDVELQVIQPFRGRFPRDGTLLLWGTHFEPGLWLKACRCERVLVVGELFRNAGLYRNLLAVRSAGLPEPSIIYVSSLLRDSALLPGAVLSPLPDLAPMFRVERDPHRRASLSAGSAAMSPKSTMRTTPCCILIFTQNRSCWTRMIVTQQIRRATSR